MRSLWDRVRGAPSSLSVRSAHLSRPGSYRVNQDSTGEARRGDITLLALADGLGGHSRGEVAARLAVERSVSRFEARPSLGARALEELVLVAHGALADPPPSVRFDGNRDGSDLRSTLVLLAMDGNWARWAHVGDSRLYHFRGGSTLSRTRDHSVPEMLFQTGEIGEEEIRNHPDRNRLVQALGQEPSPRVSVSEPVRLQDGDAFLLCSDGWWEEITEAAMEKSLRKARTPVEWLDTMEVWIEWADRERQDNYTAIAAMVGDPR